MPLLSSQLAVCPGSDAACHAGEGAHGGGHCQRLLPFQRLLGRRIALVECISEGQPRQHLSCPAQLHVQRVGQEVEPAASDARQAPLQRAQQAQLEGGAGGAVGGGTFGCVSHFAAQHRRAGKGQMSRVQCPRHQETGRQAGAQGRPPEEAGHVPKRSQACTAACAHLKCAASAAMQSVKTSRAVQWWASAASRRQVAASAVADRAAAAMRSGQASMRISSNSEAASDRGSSRSPASAWSKAGNSASLLPPSRALLS